MDKLNINFLGTGNAIPTPKRNHTSILIRYKDENILVDCGEGTQRQFKMAELSPAKLTRILITHWHGDHILGLPGLFQTLSMGEYKRTLKIYGPPGTKHFLSLLYQVLKHNVNLEVREVSNDKIEEKDFVIESRSMSHGTPTNAYSFIIKDRIRLDRKKLAKLKLPNSPLLGELQKGKDIKFNGKTIKAKSLSYIEKGKKVTIILDTGMNSNAVEIAKNSDLLISESTFSSEEKEQAKEYKHLTATDAATIAKKAKAKKLILTHISQRYENFPQIIEKEAKKTFKNVSLVNDLDSLEI